MPKLPTYATKKDLSDHMKEVKRLLKEHGKMLQKKDIKQDKELVKKVRKSKSTD